MELEGSLKTFSLPEVLQFLAMSKMTGTLAVTSPQRTIKVMIRDGRIVNTSTLNLSRKLGSLLIHHNLLQRHQLDEALQRQKADHRLLGQILVEESYVTRENLNRTIKMQLEEEVWDLFRLGEGEFKFEHGQPARDEEVIVEIEIEPLIMEGTRQLDEWHRIIKNIPGDHYIVTLAPIEGDFEKIPLTDAEWTVLSYINGRSTIGCIVNRSTLGRFETYQTLNSFMAAGLVVMQPPGSTVASGAKGPAAPDEFVIPMGGGAPALPIGNEDDTPGISPNLMNRYFRGASGEAESKEFIGKLVFMSPVGQMAEFTTRYMATLWRMPDFKPGPEDTVFIENTWRRLFDEYYRADMVRVEGNRLDAAMFERFTGFFGGVAASLRNSYEDSCEAMRALYTKVQAFANDRVGPRSAATVRDQLLEEFRQKSVVKFAPEGHTLKAALGA